jgi:hypothetical protein
LDDYLVASGTPDRLLVVGSRYSSYWSDQDQNGYNIELGEKLHPGIDVMWTGPLDYSSEIGAADLQTINALMNRRVTIWDNFPDIAKMAWWHVPLTGRSADLHLAISGFLSNPVVIEHLPNACACYFWDSLGTMADYEWNPTAYEPASSFDRWQAVRPY